MGAEPPKNGARIDLKSKAFTGRGTTDIGCGSATGALNHEGIDHWANPPIGNDAGAGVDSNAGGTDADARATPAASCPAADPTTGWAAAEIAAGMVPTATGPDD